MAFSNRFVIETTLTIEKVMEKLLEKSKWWLALKVDRRFY
jgi:hypothetical protein